MNHSLWPLLFFLLYLLLGWYIAPDYGATWDEYDQRQHGRVALDYTSDFLGLEQPVREPEYDFADYSPGRYHGLLFTMSCALLEEALGLETRREQYLLRHRAVFVLNWLGAVFFFLMLRRRFHSDALALLGVLMLVLSPRLFAHSFFNVKDMVLLPVSLISLYFLQGWLLRPQAGRLLLFSLTAALALNVRLTALLLPVLALFLAVFFLWRDPQWRPHRRRILRQLPLLLLSYPLLVVLLWPNLWEQPLRHFSEAWAVMSQHPWDYEMLLFGEWIRSVEGAWYYLPAWMLITLPVSYLLLFFLGQYHFFRALPAALRSPSPAFRQDAALFGFFWGAILAVYLTDAIIYDGWRHLFFLYPAMVYAAIWGWQKIASGRRPTAWQLWGKSLLGLLLTLEMGYLLWFSVRYHPHQNVYFNFLPGNKLTTRFEMDYWGSSYKQGLERLLQEHPRDTLTVFFDHWPGLDNYHCLPDSSRARLMPTKDRHAAEVLLTTYRWRPNLEAYIRGEPPYDQEMFTIEVRGEEILGVYGKVEPGPSVRE